MSDVPAANAAALLSKASGRNVQIVSGNGQHSVSLELPNGTLFRAVRRLQSLGFGVTVDGKELPKFSPQAKLTVCFTNADLGLVMDRLSGISGADVTAEGPARPKVTLKASGTLQEILDELTKQTGVAVRIAADGEDANLRKQDKEGPSHSLVARSRGEGKRAETIVGTRP